MLLIIATYRPTCKQSIAYDCSHTAQLYTSLAQSHFETYCFYCLTGPLTCDILELRAECCRLKARLWQNKFDKLTTAWYSGIACPSKGKRGLAIRFAYVWPNAGLSLARDSRILAFGGLVKQLFAMSRLEMVAVAIVGWPLWPYCGPYSGHLAAICGADAHSAISKRYSSMSRAQQLQGGQWLIVAKIHARNVPTSAQGFKRSI